MNSRFIGLLVSLVFSLASTCYGADLCQDYIDKQEYDKAIDACTAAIGSAGPKAYVYYGNRGFAYSKKGQNDKAVSDFTKAIELKPEDTYAYNNRSYALAREGQYDKALADSTKAIGLEPKNALSYQIRALVYEDNKQYDKAVADWSKAIELAPAEYNYLNRARLYRSRGQYDEAIADYTKLVERNPAKAVGYWFRGAVYYEKGLFGDDVQDYRKLIEIYSKDYPAVKLDLLYIRLLNASGKLSRDGYDKVLTELREYVSAGNVSSGDEKWWRTISKYYLGMDGLSENKLLDEARNSAGKKTVQGRLCDAYYSIGEKKLIEGDRKAAKEFFGKSIETDFSTSFSYRYAKAMLRLMQEGKI